MARDLEGNVVEGECLRKLNVQLFHLVSMKARIMLTSSLAEQ